MNWPPRSCDLTPLDYFLWDYVKSLVYADKPQTIDHLEDNIRRVIADIRPQMLEKVIENWTSRLDYIRASRGSPMPEIIFKMGTLNSHRAAGPLVWLVEREERWEAPDHPQGFLPLNWGGTKSNRTVTCMVLKTKANDRRKNSSPSNFAGLDLTSSSSCASASSSNAKELDEQILEVKINPQEKNTVSDNSTNKDTLSKEKELENENEETKLIRNDFAHYVGTPIDADLRE
ncbi:uncharacterized protein TNCV_33281 [Trichonephila clavipes]|nr:uncharacterized protein TNCV_33281 [Trichonephila clavipes]